MTQPTSPEPPSTSTAGSTWPNPFEIRLLGEPELRYDGAPVALKLARPRCIEVLALCVLNAPRPLTRVAASAQLWPDLGEEDARSNLRRHLSELSAAIAPYGECIIADRHTIRWNEDCGAFVDLLAFEELAKHAKDFEAALALYRGDFLSSTYEDWLFAPRERLGALAVQLAHTLAESSMRDRDFTRALAFAERALELSEWREDSLRLLMTAMYAMGNRPGALAAFDRFSTTLKKEMHVDPMAETLALRDAIVADSALPETLPAFGATESADESPFVGRADDVTALRTAWDRAARSAGNTVFVGGDAGIGKTRLVRELARYVDQQGGSVLFGHASPDAIATYQPIVDLIKGGLPLLAPGEVDDVWLGVVANAVPELFSMRAPSAPLEGERSAERLREGFARVLAAMAKRRPLLAVVEDLHWSDADTIEAIGHLARRLRGTTVLLVLTHRSEEVPLGHPLRALRRSLLAENRALMRSLAPLQADDIALLTQDSLPGAKPEIAPAVAAASGGNPLFALQILQSYAEGGDVSVESLELDTLVASRIDALAPEERSVLSLGALIDLHFTVEELAEISGRAEPDVLAAIDALLDARYVKWSAAPGFTLTFSHQLLRDVALRETGRTGRSAIHRRIAIVLDRTRAHDAQATAVIARHCELGGLFSRAYDLYFDLAKTALDIAALRSAVHLAHDAARVAPTDGERFDALRIATGAHDAIARISDEYEADIKELVECADRIGPEARFEALLAQAKYYRRNVASETLHQMIEDVLAAAHASGRDEWLARAYEEAGIWADFYGSLTNAIEHFTKALEYTGTDTVDGLRIRSLRVQAVLRAGDVERGRAEFESLDKSALAISGANLEGRLSMVHATLAIVLEDAAVMGTAGARLIAHAERTGALGMRAVGMGLLMHEAYLNGEVQRGRDMARELLEFVETQNINMNRTAIRVNTGWCERHVGNLDVAIAIWEETLADALRNRRNDAVCSSLVNIAEAALILGDYDRALSCARRVHALATETGEGRIRAESALIMGAAEAATGEVGAGLGRMRDAIEERRTISSPKAFASELALLLEAHARAGRWNEALQYADELRALYGKIRDQLPDTARICMALARAAEFAGDDAAMKRYIFEGVTALRAALARIPDEATRASQASLPYNRVLLERDPAKR